MKKPIADLCREHGIAEQTFYRWRRKYGGLNTSDVQRLKELTSENARLKRLLAERDLEVDTLKEWLAKKMVRTELRRAGVSFLKERGLSERRSCVLIGLSRSGLRYQAHSRDESNLRERLREIARRHKRYGHRRALALLRRDQLKVNHKRVFAGSANAASIRVVCRRRPPIQTMSGPMTSSSTPCQTVGR